MFKVLGRGVVNFWLGGRSGSSGHASENGERSNRDPNEMLLQGCRRRQTIGTILLVR